MKNSYLDVHPWKIIEKGFTPNKVKSSESIFSLGNGAMGQRANFEEYYSGNTFQGSYIGGVYYPDKTRVGWWKNGYPDYFAKVLNAPSWIGIHLEINKVPLDLNTCKQVNGFFRELDMKTGIYTRFFEAQITDDCRIEVTAKRFLSMDEGALGVIHYSVKALKGACEISIDSFVDGHITNQDSNWDDPFWEHQQKTVSNEFIALHSKTLKTEFEVCTFAQTNLINRNEIISSNFKTKEKAWRLSQCSSISLAEGEKFTLLKFGGYINGMNHSASQFNIKALAVINHA